jgi:hypothetical protein
MHGDDVRVMQPREELPLAFESPREGRISLASEAGNSFSATSRLSFGCRALKTQPIPPWPMSSRISSCGNARATVLKRRRGRPRISPECAVGLIAAAMRQRWAGACLERRAAGGADGWR